MNICRHCFFSNIFRLVLKVHTIIFAELVIKSSNNTTINIHRQQLPSHSSTHISEHKTIIPRPPIVQHS